MEQVWFRAPDELIEDIDRVVEQRGFTDRSEYLRHVVREATNDD